MKKRDLKDIIEELEQVRLITENSEWREADPVKGKVLGRMEEIIGRLKE